MTCLVRFVVGKAEAWVQVQPMGAQHTNLLQDKALNDQTAAALYR